MKGKPPMIQPKPKSTGGKKLQVKATPNSSSPSPVRLPPSKFQTTVNGKKDLHSDEDSDVEVGGCRLRGYVKWVNN